MSSENALLPRVWELERSLATAVRVNESLRQQLADHIKREVMLRDEVTRCRDWFETQAKVTSKGGPSSWELMLLRDERDAAQEALADTSDLDGLILCHAEPAAIGLFDYFGECHSVEHNPNAAIGPGQLGRSKAQLYRAWNPKGQGK